MPSSSPPAQTIGYRYYMGLHLVLCHGPVDAVLEIHAGERLAWSGSVTASGPINIDAPQLFGGDRREGGIEGTVDIAFGEDTQAPNGYLTAQLGSPQPAYRGVLGLVFRQVHLVSNNPYIKPMAALVRRAPKGWNESEALIGEGANPAHIIREALTNVAWGMGYPAASIDDASFAAASTTLIAEVFGLSMIWTQQTPIREFVQTVLDHIGGLLTVSPLTGRFQLKLIRDDYDVGTLPVVDESLVVDLESYQRAGWGEAINELKVIYTRRENFQDTEITLQDLASVQQQGPVSETRRYPGITDPDLAARVAMRDLTALSRPLAKIRISANRELWSVLPGDPFKFSWADLGIAEMVMRVVSVDTGTLQDDAIRIEAVEDTFAFKDTAYTAPEPVGWQDPVEAPADVDPKEIFEVPYWDRSQRLPQAELDALDTFACFFMAIGGRPTGNALNYRLQSKPSTVGWDAAKETLGDFSPYCVLTPALVPALSSAGVPFTGGVDTDLVATGRYAVIEDPSGRDHEVVLITAIDVNGQTVDLDRGLLDTVPKAHAAGARLWFAEGYLTPDLTEYASAEGINARLVTNTTSGSLDPNLASIKTLIMDTRQGRPYAPGNLKFNGAAYPASFTGDLTVTWSHRDRLSQTASFPKQTNGNIGPEAGTTYRVRIFGETQVLQRTYAGIAGTSQIYTEAQDIADNGLGRASNELTIEVDAVRGGLFSWNRHRVTLPRV